MKDNFLVDFKYLLKIYLETNGGIAAILDAIIWIIRRRPAFKQLVIFMLENTEVRYLFLTKAENYGQMMVIHTGCHLEQLKIIHRGTVQLVNNQQYDCFNKFA